MKPIINAADPKEKLPDFDGRSPMKFADLNLDLCEREVKNGSALERVAIANHLGAAFARGDFSDDLELNRVTAVLEQLSQDKTLGVRQALCDQLLGCKTVPPKIARILANDVESISVAFVRRSASLPDADLIDLVRRGDTLKQVSIARRDVVSQAVTQELVATEKVTVAKTVLANQGTQLTEELFDRILKRFRDLPAVQSLIIRRPNVPFSVSQKLGNLTSSTVAHHQSVDEQSPRSHLFDLPANTITPTQIGPTEIFDKPVVLKTVTPILTLRMLLLGNFEKFKAQIAYQAGISLVNAEKLINDQGRNGFPALYKAAGLPTLLYNAFKIALDIHFEYKAKEKADWTPADISELISRLHQAYDVIPEDLNSALEDLV